VERKARPERETQTMKKILVLGHSPGPEKGKPSRNSTRNRVARWMSMILPCLHRQPDDYEFRNVSSIHCKSLRQATRLVSKEKLESYGRIIALGREVSDFCKARDIDHLHIPHPSLLNRMWNDPRTEPSVIRWIRFYLSC